MVKLAAEAFSWKRTTTHTVLKRLCNKGLFENNNGTVTRLIPSAETVCPDVVRYSPEPAIDSVIPAIDGMLNLMIGETFAPAPGVSVNPLDIWAFTASIIWVIGLVVMLGYAIAKAALSVISNI